MIRNESIENQIKDYFSKFKQIQRPCVEKYLNEHKNIKDYLNQILNEIKEYENIKNIIICIIKNINLKKCIICNNYIAFSKISKYCSKECVYKDENRYKNQVFKMKQTCLEKYGVENPQQFKEIREKTIKTLQKKYNGNAPICSNEIKNKIKNTIKEKYGAEFYVKTSEFKEKAKQTCLEKYGVEYVFQSDNFKEKSKNTCLEKYGVEYASKNNDIKNKMIETNLKKYGIKYITQFDNFKEKRKNTCLEKYGVEYTFQDKNIKSQIKETNLKKYGVENPGKSKLIRQKIEKTCFKKYGANNKQKADCYNKILNEWKDYVIPLFTLNEYKGGGNNVYKWKCIKCGNIFEQKIYTTHFNEEFSSLPRCLKCYPFGGNDSFKELELLEFCKQFFQNAEKNKILISPLELDIVILEIKLAIEFNGIYFHSLDGDKGVSIGYHLNKVLKCNEKGYRLIHIWEDEWDNNKDEIKRKLIEIFEGKEIIDYSKPLDRSWYNNLEGEFEELPPEIVIRNGFEVENCGYLIYNKKEAELHAEEDNKAAALAEAKNKAESMIYQTEKQMKEFGDKIDGSLKSEIEGKIQAIKDVKDSGDADKINSAINDAQQTLMKIGEQIYKAQQEQQAQTQAEPNGQQTQQNADGTVDAEVVE